MGDGYWIEKVFDLENLFESELTVDADVPLHRVFDTALLDHLIKFHHEDANDLRADGCRPRRLRYRVAVYVAEVDNHG